MRRAGWILLVAVMAVLAWSGPSWADGIIIPDPPPWPEPPPLRETWLTIRYHRVEVAIEDQLAVTRVEQEFVNEHEWEAEGTYIFPLPAGAAVSKFVMWVDGQPIEGKILEAEEARRIYEDIVRRRRDPALLEYVGRDAVQARIFPIPPGGKRKIELEYAQVLPMEGGLVRYVYPLNTEKFSARALEEVSIHVEVHSQAAIGALYSPTHQDRIVVERDGKHRAMVGYEETNVLPNQDFELVYSVNEAEIGLNVLTYREPPDDGFFLLLVSPPIEVEAERIIPKDVLLVLDTSGSMEGEKIEQARAALTYVLSHLNPEDRFNIVAFSTGVRTFANSLQPSSAAERAKEWVGRLEAVGGTDINRALLEALAQVETASNRPTVLIFLTDGLPTEGVVEAKQILANVESAAPETVRLFAFGVGDDVNTALLDALAEQHHGAVSYVRPGERIDEEVSAFYAKVNAPVLTDLQLDCGDIVVEEIYPRPLPDLFAGTQLVVVGRYRDGGHARIRLEGQLAGERRQFAYEATFRSEGGDEFIPRLWATRKIGYLLTQIRLHGEEREWVDAIVELSLRYGIITPYTSFLIEEEQMLRNPVLSKEGREEAVEYLLALPTPEVSGAPAAQAADEQARMRMAESAPIAPPMPEARQMLRVVGNRTFILQGGIWTDTRFDPTRMEPLQVGFGTEAYFALLATHPEWGKFLALGDHVIFVDQGKAYEVSLNPSHPIGPQDIQDVPTSETPQTTPIPTRPLATSTPVATAEPTGSPTPSPSPGNGLCAGALIFGLVALAAVALWPHSREG